VGQSLDLYNDAIADFERENANLDASIATVRSGQLLDVLLAANPGEEMGWFWHIDHLPDLHALPNAGHLAPVLAGHEFQEAFKNYRDLEFLAHNLEQWQDNLGVFADMLENRRNAFEQRLPKIREQARVKGLSELPAQGALLRSELTRAEAEADGAAFADARERDLLQRIKRVRAALDAGAGDADGIAARERLRRVLGALTWELAQQFPDRMWAAKKALAVIDSQLGESRQHLAALAQAQQDEPARFDRFESRIAELEKRLQALLPRVTELSREQQTAVQELVVEQLEQQKERIAVYANQARYGVAQLQDRATQAKESEHAP
jgi:DNA repair ATPase RecN